MGSIVTNKENKNVPCNQEVGKVRTCSTVEHLPDYSGSIVGRQRFVSAQPSQRLRIQKNALAFSSKKDGRAFLGIALCSFDQAADPQLFKAMTEGLCVHAGLLSE